MSHSVAIRARPLELADAEALFHAADDRRIWAFHPTFDVRCPADMAAWCAEAVDGRAAGHMEPFVFEDARLGIPCGSSRLMRIDRSSGACEIGATWFGPGWWGTAANALGKRWMLEHAFQDPSRDRVYFHIDVRNRRSIAAMQRLGARLEGVLRNHMRCRDGHRRATAVFAILRRQWPSLRARLDDRLERLQARGDGDAAPVHAVERDWTSVVAVPAVATHDLRHAGLRASESRDVVDYAEDHRLECHHLGLVAAARVIGVVSLYAEPHAQIEAENPWRLRGMAVEEALRGMRIGARLLVAARELARRAHVDRIWCNARDGAHRFYAHHGFESVGPPFDVAATGHRHHLMRVAP